MFRPLPWKGEGGTFKRGADAPLRHPIEHRLVALPSIRMLLMLSPATKGWIFVGYTPSPFSASTAIILNRLWIIIGIKKNFLLPFRRGTSPLTKASSFLVDSKTQDETADHVHRDHHASSTLAIIDSVLGSWQLLQLAVAFWPGCRLPSDW